jgi:hypothetical protein
MADPVTEAAAAAAEATASSEVKKPQPLTKGEKAVAVLLLIAGVALIGLTLFAFSGTDANFTFMSKEKLSREYARHGGGKSKAGKAGQAKHKKKRHRHHKRDIPRLHKNKKRHRIEGGRSASAQVAKVVREVEFSDEVAIFALTLGAGLTLAGGFYGRLRSLKLGALELGFVSEEDKKTAADTAAAKVAAKVTDPAKQEAAKAAAQQVAIADLSKAVATGVEPTDLFIEGIADQAAKKVAAAID